MLNLVIILTVLVLEIALSKYDRVSLTKLPLKLQKKPRRKLRKKLKRKLSKKAEKEKDKIKEKKFIRHQVLYDNLELA